MSSDPLRYFRVEARELVDQISAGVLDLGQQPGPEPVARLLRFAHTLKGAARVVKQQEIADRAHAFEEVLVPHRTDETALPGDEMRELLRLNDEIEAYVAALEPTAAVASAGKPAAVTPSAASFPVSSPSRSFERAISATSNPWPPKIFPRDKPRRAPAATSAIAGMVISLDEGSCAGHVDEMASAHHRCTRRVQGRPDCDR